MPSTLTSILSNSQGSPQLQSTPCVWLRSLLSLHQKLTSSARPLPPSAPHRYGSKALPQPSCRHCWTSSESASPRTSPRWRRSDLPQKTRNRTNTEFHQSIDGKVLRGCFSVNWDIWWMMKNDSCCLLVDKILVTQTQTSPRCPSSIPPHTTPVWTGVIQNTQLWCGSSFVPPEKQKAKQGYEEGGRGRGRKTSVPFPSNHANICV